MKKFKVAFGAFIVPIVSTLSSIAFASSQVILQTNYGDITIELFEKESPQSTANFLKYVKSGRYSGTVFHRVEKDFVIQGGGFTKTYEPIETFAPVVNEAKNGLKNIRGTVAMARFTDKDSADSQFFFNLDDNEHLDHRNETNLGYGYAVFATVVKGMDVLEKIAEIPVAEHDDMGDSVPAYPVIIQAATVLSTKEN